MRSVLVLLSALSFLARVSLGIERGVCVCVLTITLFQLSDVSGSYVMEVSINSYRNPTGRCDECQPGPDPGCCDETSIRPEGDECPENSTCDPFLAYCTSPIGNICPTENFLFSPRFFSNTNNVNFDLAGSLFGMDNPLVVERNEPWSVSDIVGSLFECSALLRASVSSLILIHL